MMKPRSAPVTSIAESSTIASTSSSTRPEPSARSPSSSAAICRSSLAADTALVSTDGASSSTKNTISVSPAWPSRIWSPCASTFSLCFSPLTKVPNRDCLSRMMQAPFSSADLGVDARDVGARQPQVGFAAASDREQRLVDVDDAAPERVGDDEPGGRERRRT